MKKQKMSFREWVEKNGGVFDFVNLIFHTIFTALIFTLMVASL